MASKATYILALAYLQALEFEKAQTRFEQVAARGDSYTYLAQEGISLCQRVIEASPRTELGKQAALIREITRGELAALIVAELDLPWPEPPQRHLAKDLPPDQSQAEAINRLLAAQIPDLLSPVSDQFLSFTLVRRQDLALASVALVGAVSGRPIPRPNPFPPDVYDLPREKRFRAAVELAMEWGLMKTKALHLFDPWGSVSGSKALAVIRRAEKLGLKIKEQQP
jgi:hypothetical protein